MCFKVTSEYNKMREMVMNYQQKLVMVKPFENTSYLDNCYI